MTALSQEVGDILKNYADVIEGGNTYKGSGAAYKGIPGTDSVADELPLQITASGDGTTTTVVDDTRSWVDSDRWSRADMPPFFLCCATATNAQNVGAGRKISAWTLSTTTFTSAAFSAVTKANDTFDIREGFKRMQDGIDIESDDGIPEGFDRIFQLDFDAGEEEGVHGRGYTRYRGQLLLKLRFLKRHKAHSARQRAFNNVQRLRALLPRPEHLDGTYARALFDIAEKPEILINDTKKLIVQIPFGLIYALNTEFE